MATEADFMTALTATYLATGKTLPDNVARLWLGLMPQAGISWDSAIKALNLHLLDPDNGMYPPKPADIVRQIHGTKRDAQTGLEGRAAIEWGRVTRAISDVGGYRSVVFDDWRTMAGVWALGGWSEICQAMTDDYGVMQAQFRRSYCAARAGDYPRVLEGRHEGPPKMIGDEAKCLAILNGGNPAMLKQSVEVLQLAGGELVDEIPF